MNDSALVLNDLIECPFCGHDEFVMVGKPSGQVRYRQKFNGLVSNNNAKMYDKVKVEYTKVYCARCGVYLGNHKTNECSQKVKAALGMRRIV